MQPSLHAKAGGSSNTGYYPLRQEEHLLPRLRRQSLLQWADGLLLVFEA